MTLVQDQIKPKLTDLESRADLAACIMFVTVDCLVRTFDLERDKTQKPDAESLWTHVEGLVKHFFNEKPSDVVKAALIAKDSPAFNSVRALVVEFIKSA